MTEVSSPLPICAALGATPDVRGAVQQAKGATGRLSSLQSPFATQALLGQNPLTTHMPVHHPLTTHMPAGLASALSTSASGRKKGTRLHWESKHAFQSSLCHPDFVCNCSVAEFRGQTSCLKQLSPEQLVDFHRESFGVYIGRAPTRAEVGPFALGVRIHKLAPPRATQGGWYRRRGGQILEDLLMDARRGHNKVVCRAAWERACGAATWR